jgi:hypothetical protein
LEVSQEGLSSLSIKLKTKFFNYVCVYVQKGFNCSMIKPIKIASCRYTRCADIEKIKTPFLPHVASRKLLL